MLTTVAERNLGAALRAERQVPEAQPEREELEALLREIAHAPERPVPLELNPGQPSYTTPGPPSWWRRHAALVVAIASGTALVALAALVLHLAGLLH